MMGQGAVVVEPLSPVGQVRCAGELWRAVETHERVVGRGEKVRVVQVRGLELEVEPIVDFGRLEYVFILSYGN